MKMKPARLIAPALMLTLGLQAPLVAQTPPADSDVVVLDTFTVSTQKDNGYVAVDSLAGGRQAAPIRVTPASISSLTAEFLSDLAITNTQDALAWSLNTVPTAFRSGFTGGSGGDVFNFWSISSRGAESSKNPRAFLIAYVLFFLSTNKDFRFIS